MHRTASVCVLGRRSACIPLLERRDWTLTHLENASELVSKAQHGDTQACSELVRQYGPSVFRLALSILGREFVPEAEDVAQKVFLKAHRAIGSFRGEAEFSSWLDRIIFNQAVNLKVRARFQRPHLAESAL